MKLIIHCCYVLLFSILFATLAKAQSAYSVHTLEQGETLSTLAKNYHTTVGDIMRMNGMNAQSKLQPGGQIKIPAGGVVVAAQKPVAATVSTPATSNSATPKTHVVATGETLYHISQLYKIPMEQLKAINNLPDGNVKVGQTLLLSQGAVTATPETTKTKAENVDLPVKQKQQNEPAQIVVQTIDNKKPKDKPAQIVVETIDNKRPPDTKMQLQPQQSKTTQPTQPSGMPVPDHNVVVTQQDNSNAFNNNYPSSSNAPKEGFFTGQYGKDMLRKQEQVKNGSAMTFKSASGWADKKYYILMNDAPTGSIVKIKNGKNELYAKVLWNLSEMKENEGLAFRISTAAAAALGITDQKFDLKVNYYE